MFRYRAVKKSLSQSWYLFQLKDCPALLWDDTFFLVGKTETPVMLLDTIVRGHPCINIFEGDRVYDKRTNEELGIIVYNNGFYMQKISDSIKKFIPKTHIYVCKGNLESVSVLRSFERTPISFKYFNTEFDFGDLVAVDKEALTLIIQSKPKRVNLNGVTELLYYNRAKKYRGYDGDILDGKFLTLESVVSISLD